MKTILVILLLTFSVSAQDIEGELDFDALDKPEDTEEAVPPPPASEPAMPEPPAQVESVPSPPSEEPAESAPTYSSNDTGDLGDADSRFEARLARIYQKYDQTEISEEEWNQIAGPRISETYTLQPGDTLWDISTKFFGNGFYWPKVWQLNAAITNPHLIQPGNTLNFNPGNVNTPPALGVQQAEGAEPPPQSEPESPDVIVGEAGNFSEDGPIIPPPSVSKPVLTQLPPSFFDWRSDKSVYDESGFAAEAVVRRGSLPQLSAYVTSLATDGPWDSAGKIIETELGADVAATNQKIIVEMKGQSASQGQLFTVFTNLGSIEDMSGGGSGAAEVRLNGVIQILDPIPGSEGYYSAIVKRAIYPLKVGDGLRAENVIPRVELDAQGSSSPIAARIINGEFGKRRVFGLHNVVYLNKGADSGLQAGAILDVIKNWSVRDRKKVVKYYPYPVGKLKVVNVGSRVATAIVVAEKDDIRPGDETAVSGSYTTPSDEVEDDGVGEAEPDVEDFEE